MCVSVLVFPVGAVPPTGERLDDPGEALFREVHRGTEFCDGSDWTVPVFLWHCQYHVDIHWGSPIGGKMHWQEHVNCSW
jgi:hypothetical protein